MKFKLLFLLNLLSISYFTKSDNQSLESNNEDSALNPEVTKIVIPIVPLSKVKELREAFRPILEVPAKFLKFRSLWYEGNHRQQMTNILKKEKIKRIDLQNLIDLLNREEKLLNYKAAIIADAANAVIMKKFLKELSHLMPENLVEKEARAKFINPAQLVSDEKASHRKIIQEHLVPLIKALPAIANKS
jgi:hypothetical protein